MPSDNLMLALAQKRLWVPPTAVSATVIAREEGAGIKAGFAGCRSLCEISLRLQQPWLHLQGCAGAHGAGLFIVSCSRLLADSSSR